MHQLSAVSTDGMQANLTSNSRSNSKAAQSAPSAAIIGAGLSGLSAAFRLQQLGWRVEVFEASGRAGGRVQTVPKSGYLFDTGASALAESYTSYFSLAEELGIRSEIAPASPYIGVYRDEKIHLLNLNRMLSSALFNTSLSPRSKVRTARLAFDIAMAKLRGQLDYSDMRRAAPLDTETAAEYALRVLNPEIDAYLGSPVIRTMLIADTDQVSKVELFSGIANIFAAKLYALKGGQERMAQLLAERVNPQFLCPVTRVVEHPTHVELEVRTSNGDSRLAQFDACIVSCPAPQAERICVDKRHWLEPLTSALTYTQAITVGVGTRVVPNSPAVLVQMPACEDAEIALLFLDHNKCKDRAPAGHGLIDCQWETRASTKMMDADDDAIIARSLQTLFRVFPEVKGSVEEVHVTRWSQALPLTSVGVYKKMGEFNARIDPASRIQFASDYMAEAGQNTAVELANRAARTLHTHHGEQRASKSGAL